MCSTLSAVAVCCEHWTSKRLIVHYTALILNALLKVIKLHSHPHLMRRPCARTSDDDRTRHNNNNKIQLKRQRNAKNGNASLWTMTIQAYEWNKIKKSLSWAQDIDSHKTTQQTFTKIKTNENKKTIQYRMEYINGINKWINNQHKRKIDDNGQWVMGKVNFMCIHLRSKSLSRESNYFR